MRALFTFAALLPIFFCLSCTSPKQELHLFVWNDYIRPELISRFEELYNCKVIADVYDTNELMYAKLSFNGGRYDVILPSNYYMELLIKQGMLQRLDTTLLPNLSNLDPHYTALIPAEITPYGLPFAISISGIGYRSDKIPPPTSWGVFKSESYAGKMTMLSESREAIGATLKFLGYSVNTTDSQEIAEAADMLISWKPLLARFEQEQYKGGLVSAEYILSQGYDGDVLQAIQENPAISFAYPSEGTFCVMDLMAIPRNAPHPFLAHAFINFLLDGENAAQNMTSTLFFMPNSAAYNKLPSQLAENPVFQAAREAIAKTELIRYLAEGERLYEEAWDRVKAH